MSSLKDKLKMFKDSMKVVGSNVIQGKEITVSDEEYHKRMAVCSGCPKFIAATKQCGECGCFLQVKAKLNDMKCPLDKWQK